MHLRYNIIYAQNYALKYTIKYVTITYISKLLKLLLFFTNINLFIYFFCPGIYKMVKLTRKEYNVIAKNRCYRTSKYIYSRVNKYP